MLVSRLAQFGSVFGYRHVDRRLWSFLLPYYTALLIKLFESQIPKHSRLRKPAVLRLVLSPKWSSPSGLASALGRCPVLAIIAALNLEDLACGQMYLEGHDSAGQPGNFRCLANVRQRWTLHLDHGPGIPAIDRTVHPQAWSRKRWLHNQAILRAPKEHSGGADCVRKNFRGRRRKVRIFQKHPPFAAVPGSVEKKRFLSGSGLVSGQHPPRRRARLRGCERHAGLRCGLGHQQVHILGHRSRLGQFQRAP